VCLDLGLDGFRLIFQKSDFLVFQLEGGLNLIDDIEEVLDFPEFLIHEHIFIGKHFPKLVVVISLLIKLIFVAFGFGLDVRIDFDKLCAQIVVLLVGLLQHEAELVLV
jgi:hypothetical protein